MVYTKGAVVNLYQIMMDTSLPFNYRALAEDEYKVMQDNTIHLEENYRVRKNRITFNEHKFKPREFPQTSKTV